MARKTKQQALETRQHILDVALRLFSQQGVSSTSLAAIAKAAGVTRGAIYWHFKNKSDLFNEIWVLSEASISDLEVEYRAKFPNDPLSVVREILVYVLEATVTEERRRLMMEIIFHKCEFVGEMTAAQEAQRSLCLESYDRIEHTLNECIAAKMLPANLLTRRAAILMRSYLSGLDGKLAICAGLFRSAKRRARICRDAARDVSVLPFTAGSSRGRALALRLSSRPEPARKNAAIRRYSRAGRSAILRAATTPGILRLLQPLMLTLCCILFVGETPFPLL
ncbi:Potential acrAB operon repressor [Raoultella terrigena]|uniref:Potential acrAB operon repressor n=1 Tax=Raoultella terrigena TaxID=577 RepID=A0A485B4Y9_RAOTE|nr:Potential acrAB operon repressor [Raoultella terrigena]